MDEIEALMHEIGTAFVAGLLRAGSMRASVIAQGHRSQTYDAGGNAARIGRWGPMSGNDVDAMLARLRTMAGIEGTLLAELSGAPAGEYTVSYHAQPDGGGLTAPEPVLVLDSEYRFPDHPRPGMPRPAATLNDGGPTDPAVLAEVRDLVERFGEAHTRWRGKPPAFAPGYSEEEILAAERQMGFRLPEEVRALYRTIHDDNAESGLLGRFSALPLEQMVAWYHQGDPGSYGWNDALFEDNPVVFETHPHGHVRRVSRSDWWVTFAPDYGMNYAALDLDPGPAGNYGQLLMFGRDVWGPIVHVAPSVRHVMRQALALLDTAQPQDDRIWQQVQTPDHQWSAEVAGADLAALVAAGADPSLIQSVHLRQADRVAFKDLAALPHLRAIRVLDVRQPATHVDLSIPDGLPVEQVDVAAEHFDPRLLATTATLRYLTLAGNTEPVRIAELAALPELVRLDLSDADVADIGALATFPALRVLTLNAAQWQQLFDTGWTPHRLAAARLAGRGAVSAAASWHTSLRGAGERAAEHRTVRGPR